MQSVEIQGLDKLDSALKKILDEAPAARRELHERIAARVQSEVAAQVDASGIHDDGGKIKGWQEGRVGSGGGYAAVSAVSNESGPSSPGAITYYLNSGHKIRPPGKTRRSRVKVAYVNGRHFYQAASERAEAIAYEEVEKFAAEIAKKLEG